MIIDRLNNKIDELSFFDDDLDKYEYIVEVGKKLKPLDKDLYIDSLLVKGCTSKVWLTAEYIDNKVNYLADSNSVIVKGLVAIITDLFSGSTPEEIINFDTNELEKLNLAEIITPTRQNGVFHMINKVKEYASSYMEGV